MLELITKANDIKNIPPAEYAQLAKEIRSFLIKNISETGGHLGSNLGCVELTMALHLALDLNHDKIVFDVGHQSYTHKILTGRKEQFKTLRKYGGMCGFPKMREDSTDVFGTGHSSTSISAALGLAAARDIHGTNETVVAVIGDGALSGGMAYEALNNMGHMNKNFIVILNDNKMSISEPVGGMAKYLSHMRLGQPYNELKSNVEKALLSIPKIGEGVAKTIKRSKDSIKQLLVPGMLFEEMGITYAGPIDGHDIKLLIQTIADAKLLDGPILIHVKTQKGRGYKLAEHYPEKFHGVDPFDITTGKPLSPKTKATYTDVFSKTMVDMGKVNKDLVAVTAAMPVGTGLDKFMKEFPKRCFDVGIAEEHGVTFSAGLAAGGLKPVVAIYSSFLQRAYDQILHDVCIQKLPVVFALDRSGLVGADGETHQGVFDISFLSNIPNLTIIAPKNGYELKDMLKYAISFDGPIALKYPRGAAYAGLKEYYQPIEHGKSETIYKQDQGDVAILAVGGMVEEANKVYESLTQKGHQVSLTNVRFIKPMDTKVIDEMAKTHKLLVTIEENMEQGGYGQMVSAYLKKQQSEVGLLTVAISDRFVCHGSVDQLRAMLELDAASIVKRIEKQMRKEK